jgi:hypothetical protein
MDIGNIPQFTIIFVYVICMTQTTKGQIKNILENMLNYIHNENKNNRHKRKGMV